MANNDVAYDDLCPVIGDEANSGRFVVLTPGIYPFTIDEPVENERYSGSEKVPPCWKVIVKFNVDGGKAGSAKVFYNIFVTHNNAWRIVELFKGVGKYSVDAEGRFTPNWNALVGTSGAMELDNREYNGKTYNDVKKILEPDEAAEAIGRSMAQQSAYGFPS